MFWTFFLKKKKNKKTFCCSAGSYELQVPENHKVNEKIGVLELEDRDQLQNKEPTFIIPNDISRVFGIELSPNKDGNLMLRKVGRWCRFSVCASIGAKFEDVLWPQSLFCVSSWSLLAWSQSSLTELLSTQVIIYRLYIMQPFRLTSQAWLLFTLPADDHLSFIVSGSSLACKESSPQKGCTSNDF